MTSEDIKHQLIMIYVTEVYACNGIFVYVTEVYACNGIFGTAAATISQSINVLFYVC